MKLREFVWNIFNALARCGFLIFLVYVINTDILESNTAIIANSITQVLALMVFSSLIIASMSNLIPFSKNKIIKDFVYFFTGLKMHARQ